MVIEIFTDPTPDGGFVTTIADISALAQAEAEAHLASAQSTFDSLAAQKAAVA